MSLTYHSLQLLLLLLISAGCLAIQSTPRRLLRCPDEFETLVVPLSESEEGDPILLIAGLGVRLRTVEFLRDAALRVEGSLLLLNKSTDAASDVVESSPYSGPHVILCSDPLPSSFSLFIKLPSSAGPQLADSPAAASASFNSSIFEFAIALIACVATCLATCLALVLTSALLRLLRLRRHVGLDANLSSSHRDFRLFTTFYRTSRKLGPVHLA